MSTLSIPRVAMAIAASSVFLLLAGCAAEGSGTAVPAITDEVTSNQDEGSNGDAAPQGQSAGTVTIELPDQYFSFDTTTCMITDDDVLAAGPGVDDSGNPAYLDIDLVTVDDLKQGEVRVNLGTDAPFTTTDDFHVAFIGPDHEYGLLYEADGLMIQAAFKAEGESPIGPGTVRMSCK